eukprot:Clim_evm22s195 gene=Clim_evmTU22s195
MFALRQSGRHVARLTAQAAQIHGGKSAPLFAPAFTLLRKNYSTEVTSFARNMFLGKVNTTEAFPYPDSLSAEEKDTLAMILSPTEKFFDEVNDAAQNDIDGKIPDEVLESLKELGAFGLQVPQDLGGIGLSNTGYARMTEIVGANDLGVGIALGSHQSIGFKGIMLDGNDAQKEKYLPKLASGEMIASFALTEPGTGSDASSVKTKAVLSNDGKHWILNGSKIWISGGGLADLFTVFARTEVKDEKTGELKDKMTAFIVERGFGGVSNGPPERKMGIKCSNTVEVYFEDCKVPVENVLGEVGDGFKVAMRILNNGRFGMGAALTGTMKTCIQKAIDQANQRTQFGDKIKNYGLIQEKIAEMSTRLYATESVAYMVSGNMDKGSEDYQIEAAISKIFASENAWFVADETIQTLGGNGFMMDHGVERVLRDLRIFRIFEGTNDILRLFIGLTGMQGAGKELQGLQKALKNPLGGAGAIAAYGQKRLGRAMGMGIPKIPEVHSDLQKHADQLSRGIQGLHDQVEGLLMKHGKGIINQQMPAKRVADCAIDMYAMAAVLSRATRSLNQGAESAERETLLAGTFCDDAYRRVEANLAQLSGDISTSDENYKKISELVCGAEGYDIPHPVQI